MRLLVKGLLPVLILCLAAQPARAICSCARQITSGNSYVITPGCEANDCGTLQTSVTDDLVGYFWGLGEGDPEPGTGIDNGSFEALGGWLYVYPGYGALITSTWGADAGIDGCTDFATHPEHCMAIALIDKDANTGAAAFAVLTKKPDNLANYYFMQPGNITLTPLPAPIITNSIRIGYFEQIRLSLTGLSESDIAAGIYLDPECSPPHPIAGYRVYYREAIDRFDSSASGWTALTDVLPLGTPVEVTTPCPTPEQLLWALAYGLEFDSGYGPVFVSGPSTEYSCEELLADPHDVGTGRERPRNRERRPTRR